MNGLCIPRKEQIIDFTRYDIKAQEPVSGSTRNWTLFGDINQKQTRNQDAPLFKEQLSEVQKMLVESYYPGLIK